MKKTAKRVLSAAVAFLLASLMAFQLPAQVFADSKPEYISEIKISIADESTSSDKARQAAAQKKLTDAGYTLLTHSSDYKEGSKSVAKKGDAVNINYGTGEIEVYLGYKTTTDRDDAVTDISMMEMAKDSDKNKPYSFAAYDEMLKEYKKEINASISNIEDTLSEFSANYKKGSPAAKWAYEQLNRYSDPDIEKNNKIGDVLLSIADGGITDDEKEQIQNYYLKSNINFVSAMNTALGVGCAEYQTEDTWIDRFAASSSDDEYENSYDSTVDSILNSWASFYEMLANFEKTGLGADCTDEEAEKYLEKLDSEKAVENIAGLNAYRILAKYEYNGEPMLDFFMQSGDPDDIDKDALIPLAASLTKGQRAMVNQIGIKGLFSILDNTKTNWETLGDTTDEFISQMADYNDVTYNKKKTISIYEGVNEAMFDSSGVALTSEAMVNQSSTQDSSVFKSGVNALYMLVGCATVLAGIATTALSVIMGYTTETLHSYMAYNLFEDAMVEVTYSTVDGLTGSFLKLFVGSIAIILIGAGLILWSYVDSYYHPNFTEIPSVMVDAVSKTSKQGITTTYYTYYDAVKCDYNGKTDIPADTNAWTGKRWNAMYVTKDETAGDPILASDFSAQYGSKEKKNCTPVARFHEESAYNMNAHHYGDDVKGIYLFYTSDDGSASYEGTVISTADLGLGIGGGAIGGFAVAASTMYAKFKNMLKKKKITK